MHNSISTAKTTSSPVSHLPSTGPQPSGSPAHTSTTAHPNGGDTDTPVLHTTTASTTGRFTTYSTSTVSASSSHITGTGPTPSSQTLTETTHGTTPMHNSISTAKTTSSPVSHLPSTGPQPSGSPAHTSTTAQPTGGDTDTPVPHTTTASTTGPFTTYSTSTVSASSSHITGVPTGTSFKTTTRPVHSHPDTTLSTQVPPFSTSSVTPTSDVVVTHSPQTTGTSAHLTYPTGTLLPTSTSIHTGTGPTTSSQPLTETTHGTTPMHNSISTAKTTSSPVSHLSSTGPQPSGSPAHTSTTAQPTGGDTDTPVLHTPTASTTGPFTTYSTSTVTASSSHITGACSVQEHQEEITYQGCSANITVTRCYGTCISSSSINLDTEQVDTQCGCCRPEVSYKKPLELPCPDPKAPGRRLVLLLQVFSSCVCGTQACRN
ncbi:uncharacterized protein LOC142445016 [Tenrec ecaudatus]|uniref:uncharacterized protein LOC142445016 n=1 Tax=Tenrec ecaudatus TaxID=94439 RepID=UPI003F5964EA